MKRVFLVVLLVVGCSKPTEPIPNPPDRISVETWALTVHYPDHSRAVVMSLSADGSGAWRDSLAISDSPASWRNVESSYLILLFTSESTISLSMRRTDDTMQGTFYEDGHAEVGGQAEAVLR